METINVRCDGCDKVYEVRRTKEISPETKSLSCNWCIECEDDATEDYKETHHYNDIFGEPDPNQLILNLNNKMETTETANKEQQNNNEQVVALTVIEQALEKENITKQIITKLKSDYSGLKINGIDDVDGFNKVEAARKHCKAVRIATVSICKTGREKAIQEQKDWIAKEKEVVGEVEEIELELKSESERIKLQKEKILFEAAQRAKLPARKEKLLTIGIGLEDEELLKLDDFNFDKLFNEFYVKYLEEIAAKSKQEAAEAAKKEAERVAEEKRLATEKAETERLEAKRIADQKAEEQRLENERLKKEAEEKEKIRAARNAELRPYIVFIRDYNNVLSMSEEDYQKEFIDIKLQAQQQFEFEQKEAAKKEALAKEQEQLRQKEIAEQQERERLAKEAKDKAEAALAEERRLAKEESERQAEIIKKQQEENERLAKEAKDKAEAEAAAQEKEKAEAEEKERQRVTAEKQAALAPDKDKMKAWIEDLSLPFVELKQDSSNIKASDIKVKFSNFKLWAMTEIDKM